MLAYLMGLTLLVTYTCYNGGGLQKGCVTPICVTNTEIKEECNSSSILNSWTLSALVDGSYFLGRGFRVPCSSGSITMSNNYLDHEGMIYNVKQPHSMS